ncbi:MAG: mRNA 3'-end processing factor [Euryarchaeota archaeon RBG_16_68_12]|nr:MAG: mRNA 3'-end processing factor [Euryarchaeota archaeon RBG_16_68_12]
MEIQFLGGATEVGRLGMLLREGPEMILFDYGVLPKDPPQYPLKAPPVDLVFVSHAHLDHSGMVPWLCGRHDTNVVLTPVTSDVTDLLLLDSLKVADLEGYDPPFDDGDIQATRRNSRTVDFGDALDVGSMEVTLHPAGHIPGATMFEVNGNQTTLFTGDLHTLTTDLVRGAKPVPCDTLVIESTYAGRNHPDRFETQYQFLEKIRQVNNRGGLALVPAFAVGRTQEVLLALANGKFDVWLDGMGKTVNGIYLDHPDYLRSSKALKHAMGKVQVVRGGRGAHQALQADVIVTTSGMLDGGPVLRYLEQIREDPRSAILLTGYQVEGTNGRRLIEEGLIDMGGVDVKVKCEWQKFDFSAHAGHDELVRFVEGCDPQRVVLMHGDHRELLAEALQGRETLLPVEGQWYPL